MLEWMTSTGESRTEAKSAGVSQGQFQLGSCTRGGGERRHFPVKGNGRMGRQEALVHDVLGEGQSRARVVLP